MCDGRSSSPPLLPLSSQNEADVELYRREIAELAGREARQREVLRGLWEERQALVAKDERFDGGPRPPLHPPQGSR